MKKNLFKKTLSSLIVVCLLCTTLLAIHADNNSDYIFNYGDTEVIISSEIDYSKAEMIANKIADITDENEISMFGIFCLFGHAKEYTTSMSTQHNYRIVMPRCRVEIYDVEYCTRSSCDYTVQTLVSVSYKDCH